jgi:hypothetical protein
MKNKASPSIPRVLSLGGATVILLSLVTLLGTNPDVAAKLLLAGFGALALVVGYLWHQGRKEPG